MRVKTQLLLGNGIILGIFVIVSIVSIFSINSLITNSEWVSFTHNVIGSTNRILGYVVDQETGVRGYMATGDESFLEPYHEGRKGFAEELARTKTLVGGTPEAVALFEELDRLAGEWEGKVLAGYISTRKGVNEGKAFHAELLDLITSGEGKKRMDAFRKRWKEVCGTSPSGRERDACWMLLQDMLNMETGVRGFLITGNEKYLEPYNEGEARLEKHFDMLNRAGVSGADELRAMAQQWVELVGRKEIDLKREMLKYPTDSDLKELMGTKQGKQYVDKIRETVADIIALEEKLLNIREESAKSTAFQAIVSTSVGGLLAVLAVLGVLLLVNRNISKPIVADMEFARAIADGDLDATIEIERDDELGELARTLNRMAKHLKSIDWLKRGKEGLDDELRGEHAVDDFVKRFITYFTEHLEAQIGALYIREGDTLILTASHAFTDRKGIFNAYKLGEGMVGQAALENKTIVFTGVEDDAPGINYGAGEITATDYMIVPVSFEGVVFGVLLLGSAGRFSRLQRLFVEQNIENVAILFNAAKSRETIRSLLNTAQENQKQLEKSNSKLEAQAEALRASEAELQAQQEELRVTNEELEEQTKALKESQSELQAQQEELRVTNEELEERTEALEQQKESIRAKNTDLVKAQAAVEQKAKDLEIASRYKSEFLANMSHELRTPLNSILILSQLFGENKDNNLSDTQVESAKAIHASGTDLLTLINEILDLSKVEAGKIELVLEDTRLDDIIDSTRMMFKDVADDKGLDFEITVADGLPQSIMTDSQRLHQILRNLLTNAFKFTSRGTVALHMSRPDEGHTPEWLESKKSVSFSVADQGIGIPKEQKAAIFEAFQQADGSTSRKYGGTGLGLSISKELCKLLGGFIYLDSEEGKGSTFTVTLPEQLAARPGDEERTKSVVPGEGQGPAELPPEPAPEKASGDAPQEASPVPAISSQGAVRDDRKGLVPEDRSLLIIEDDSTFAKVVRDFARDHGFKCIVAEDGETGLHFADYYKPSAIILDIGLPGIDGWAVMERLKDNPDLRHIPVHFMSAADSSLEAMRMGAVGFLSKPVTREMVETAFSRIEDVISKPMARLLVVEDDKVQRDSIQQLIGGSDVETIAVETGGEALRELEKGVYDCVILDLGLTDMSGFDLLDKISQSDIIARVPIIIYTGRELTRDEESRLRQYTESIIIKGAKSPERLLNETALFLHRVEADLPESQRRMLQMTHDKEVQLSGKKVLLVDDDMRNVFALKSVFEGKGLNVVVACNGLEALERLKENPDVDLVLMDIMMPQMDGYEAMGEIRKERRHAKLPIIALTAKAMKGDRGKCIDAGANDYLAKPVNTEKLLSMMRVWMY